MANSECRVVKARIGKVIKWMVLRFGVATLVVLGFGAMEAAPIEALLKTSVGEIRFELYPDKAPATVRNFLKYVDGGHFEEGSFYRVVRMDNQEQNTVKIEVIQGGLSGKTDAVSYDPIPLERIRGSGFDTLMEPCLWPGQARIRPLQSFLSALTISPV